jgi:hypothetical protein
MNGSWDFFWQSIRFDAGHPPLDYLTARLWQTLSPSETARKIPVVFWGVGAVAAFGLLVARRTGSRAGLIAAVLLACAPFHVRYSQELRPYSLSLFLLSLSLLTLEGFLSRPGTLRLVLLFCAFLATIYTAYILQIVLFLAAGGMLIEDAFRPDPGRRRIARLCLAWSPLFLALLAVAYLPWWPVQLEAARRPSVQSHIEPFGFPRIGRILSFFFFAPDGGHPLGWEGAFCLVLAVGGAVLAGKRAGGRFLILWSLAGLAVIELLLRLHPYWDAARIYLPAGIALIALVALPLASLLERRRTKWIGSALLAVVLFFDARGLLAYFREGRADWRPLADFLRGRPKHERVFTENQYSELCVAFYVEGPAWAYRRGRLGRDVWNLDGEIVRLTWSWKPGSTAWLVIAGEPPHQSLRDWAKAFPSQAFPGAEGAILYRLDSALRDRVFPPAR